MILADCMPGRAFHAFGPGTGGNGSAKDRLPPVEEEEASSLQAYESITSSPTRYSPTFLPKTSQSREVRPHMSTGYGRKSNARAP